MINYTVTWTLSNLATNDYVAKSYQDEFKQNTQYYQKVFLANIYERKFS